MASLHHKKLWGAMSIYLRAQKPRRCTRSDSGTRLVQEGCLHPVDADVHLECHGARPKTRLHPERTNRPDQPLRPSKVLPGVRMLSSSTVLRMVDMEDARVVLLMADHVMAAHAAVETFMALLFFL